MTFPLGSMGGKDNIVLVCNVMFVNCLMLACKYSQVILKL